MRWSAVLCLLIAALVLSACGGSLKSQPPPPKWTTGFWFWSGSPMEIADFDGNLDAAFLHVGDIRKPERFSVEKSWSAWVELPRDLPKAREYWLVFRYNSQSVPDLQAVPVIVSRFTELRRQAEERNLKIAGIQLDIDSPTSALARYAGFLREIRKSLLAVPISITALLDWFRDGTAIAEVVKEVDEFVPQFYDLNGRDLSGGGAAIASRIDATRWAPVFNRFRKRYRIGISSFGRARIGQREDPSGYPHIIGYYRDLTPLDVALNRGFRPEPSRNDAAELVLKYTATQKVRIGYRDFAPGETLEFIVPTHETIRAAVNAAKQMRGYCAGVVFFRWPGPNDSLVLRPDEVLSAAGAGQTPQKPSIHLVDGHCAAVSCADVYLLNANSFAPHAVRYRMHSSATLEYFLPEERMPARMIGDSDLELSLPPYSGSARMYLGRAVSIKRAQFTVEEEP